MAGRESKLVVLVAGWTVGMPGLVLLDTDIMLLAAMAALAPLTSASTMVFASKNRFAHLKIIMQTWYVLAFVAGILNILVSKAYPATSEYWMFAFNCVGQLIAITGAMETCQLAYCLPRLLSLAETNRAFLVRCAVAYAVAISIFAAALIAYHFLGHMVLTVYRSFTMIVVAVEVAGYCWCEQPMHLIFVSPPLDSLCLAFATQ